MKVRARHLRNAVLLAGLFWLPGVLWAQESRLALVIGNSNYEESPLINPENDARDMADVLEGLGFKVILRIDADRREMARAIRDFGRELKDKRGVGLFYYAGHGMQIDNRNFLIPVDTPLEEEDEVPFDSVDVGSVLAKMESAGNSLNLLILDACRNNPFPRQFRSSNRGLARVDAPVGSLVVYSTAPGNVAADGEGRNGVFTGALLEQLRTDGLSLTQTIRRTRAAVVRATDGRQVPWESSSLLQDYYLSEQRSQDTNEPAAPEALDQTAGPIETIEVAEIVEAEKIVEVAEIVEPAKPVEAVEIVEPIKPVEAAEIIEPIKPVEAVETIEPVKPVEAVEPIQLARLETDATRQPPIAVRQKPKQDGLGSLTINVEPADARVRIMNIIDKYIPGIKLDRSLTYDVYVTSPGYESFREQVSLDAENKQLSINLRSRDPVDPVNTVKPAISTTQSNPIKPTAPTTPTNRGFVSITGGAFAMGCSSKDSLCESYEKPAHTVRVAPFGISRTEVTVAEFSRFVEASGYLSDAHKNAGGNNGCYIWREGGGISRASAKWEWRKGASWQDPGYPQESDYPVSCVSWNDATAYADWLSQTTGRRFTLPSEAEWEFAARAGVTTAYGTGIKSRSLCQQSNIADTTLSPAGSKWSDRFSCNDKFWFSAPVASFEANALGLHDMQGNVWEWVQDNWTATFDKAPDDGRANLSGSTKERVLRGGAWESDEKRARLSSRSKASTSSRTAMTGFRLVLR